MYMLTAPVSQHLITAIAPYRQKFDPLATTIPPHLVVLRPFQFPDKPETLNQHLAEVCDLHAPVKVSLTGWDILEGKCYQLRLPVMRGRLELIALYSHLATGPLSYIAEQAPDYQPHLIFGRLASLEEVDRAKAVLRRFEIQFIFRVNHLELWQRQASGESWQLVRKFGLKATAAGQLRRPGK